MEKVKYTGEPEKAVTWLWLEDGTLKYEHLF